MPVSVSTREKTGSIAARRFRSQGQIPANVYGHQQDPQSITISEDIIRAILTAGERVIDISIDGQVQTTMLKDVQWDSFGIRLMHVDLFRVDSDEKVEVEVPIELRGTSEAATSSDAVLDQVMYALTVECSASKIPHDFQVKISDLQLGDSITVADIEVPEGVICTNPPDAVIVQVTQAEELPEEEETGEELAAAEPEVIGRARDEEADSED